MASTLIASPDPATAWQAVLAKDKDFDGHFVVGVTSTGIYCRPSCPARRPLRKNVKFFPTPTSAEGAGLRACRRCDPKNGRSSSKTGPQLMAERISRLDWEALEASLWERGYAQTGPVLSEMECRALRALYSDDRRFRKTVDMARHRFGVGEYKYLARPLPETVESLRRHVYPRLSGVANAWMEALGSEQRYPETLAWFLKACAKHGQRRPTPLLLRYEEGGYNCLHQDLYGDVAFPFQLVVQLSKAGSEYTGGEFLLVEQRPRAQSAGEVITAARGELLIFTTRVRPVAGQRGHYRVNVRHGVSRVRSGRRYALGIIFHDAK